jgi:hypothetical protein
VTCDYGLFAIILIAARARIHWANSRFDAKKGRFWPFFLFNFRPAVLQNRSDGGVISIG